MIDSGSFCTVTHDVMIGQSMAFMAGEVVRIEAVVSNPERPEYRYVVTSGKIGQRFQLSAADLMVKPSEVPARVPRSSPPVAPPAPQLSMPAGKPRSTIGKWIALALAAIFAITVAAVGIAAAVNKVSKTKGEAATATTPAKSAGTFRVVYQQSGNTDYRSGIVQLGPGEKVLKYEVTAAIYEGHPLVPTWAIYVMQNGTSLDVEGGSPEITAMQAGPGETHLEQREGMYYVDVKAINCVWTVTIEEKM